MNAALRQFAIHQVMIFLTFLGLYHLAHYTGFIRFAGEEQPSMLEVSNLWHRGLG
jgi:hypothetical protein